MIITLTPNNLH